MTTLKERREELLRVATDDGQLEPLGPVEIEELCEQLNVGSALPVGKED